LAAEFNMTKATISDTVKTLEQKGLITKEYEQHDTRSYIIHLTKTGHETAKQTSLFAEHIQIPINKLDTSDKENFLLNLLDIIHHLNKSGIITIQRMCFTCQFYKADKTGQEHFCNLLNTKLTDSDLRIDCPEHKEKQTV
jgi:DNA-binding MarR family transcriptional regulator